MPPREKVNAEEWKIKEQAGVHKGNVYSYVNQWVDEEQASESANEGPAPPPADQPTAYLGAKARLPPRNTNQFQRVTYKKPPHQSKHKQPITFAIRRDNAARVAFRNNQPPNATYDLGNPLIELEPSVARLQRSLEEIGVRFGSFIVPKRALDDSKIVIWGNQKQLGDTIRELKQWRHHRRTHSTARESLPLAKELKFARITSTIGIIHAAEEKKAKRDAERLEFQKVPTQGRRFKSNGYYLWPNNEIRVVDLFGPNCEALDPLRMEHRAYILFDEARSVFKIHSDKGAENVHQVTQRIESTIKEYVARDHRPATLILIEPLSPSDFRHEIRTVAGPPLGVTGAQSKIPVLHGKKIKDQHIAGLRQEAEKLGLINRNRANKAVQKVLERLPYYRGHLRMRVNFGTFTLVKFQWPPGVHSVTLEKFTTDIKSAGTKGTLIRNIRSIRAPLEILDCCYTAGDLFQPVGTSESSLKEVPPQYAAMFYLRHPEKQDEMLQLEVVFKASAAEGEDFEGSKAIWLKGGKPDAVTQAAPLEVFGIRLHSGVSWQLKISTENVMDPTRITPRMENFANGIIFKRPPFDEYPAISGYKVFTSPNSLPILGMEQKTTFRYALKAQPSFVFELSRYDEYNGDDPRFPSSTQWAATFYDRDWENNLSENAKLGIGYSASWNPHTRPFFQPMQGSTSKGANSGFNDFLHHIQAVAGFLDKVKGSPPQAVETENVSDKDSHSSEFEAEIEPDQTAGTDNKASEESHASHSGNEITPDQLDLFERSHT